MLKIGLVVVLLSMWGCSSMLYYPTRKLYVDPSKHQLSPEEVWLTTEDNKKLFAWYFNTEVKKPKGVFVLFHGNAENISSHYLSLLWVLPKGYDLFVFDYQGYGRSEGSPSPENTVRDGQTAVRWVAQHKPKREIILFGQSLGGAIAMRTAAELKGDIKLKLIVAESTFHSYEAVGTEVLSNVWFTWPFQWFAKLALDDEYAPTGHISKISPTPLVVIHSEADQTIHHKFGKAVFEEAKEPKKFWLVKKSPHIQPVWKNEDQLQDRLLAYLENL